MTKRKIEITNDFGEPISLRSKSDEESNKSIKIKSNDTNYRVEKDDEGKLDITIDNVVPIETNNSRYHCNHGICGCKGIPDTGYADAYLNEKKDDVDEYEDLVDVLDADGYELLDDDEDLVNVIDDEDEDDVDFICDYKPLDARKHRPSLVDSLIKEIDEDKPNVLKPDNTGIDVSHDDIRAFNIGASDYSQHKIQPWDIWEEYNLNPWEADIVKRVLRTKCEDGLASKLSRIDSRIMDFEKIIHVARKCIELLKKDKERYLYY